MRGMAHPGVSWVAAGIVSVSLLACATPGAPPDPPSSREVTTRAHTGAGVATMRMETETQARAGTVVQTIDRVWSAMPALFEQLGIETTLIDPQTHTMGNRSARVRRVDGERLARWLDCGYGSTAQPYANQYDVTLGIVVRLVDVQGTATEVRTTLEASAKPRMHSGHAVQCSSKGTLEARVAVILHELTA